MRLLIRGSRVRFPPGSPFSTPVNLTVEAEAVAPNWPIDSQRDNTVPALYGRFATMGVIPTSLVWIRSGGRSGSASEHCVHAVGGFANRNPSATSSAWSGECIRQYSPSPSGGIRHGLPLSVRAVQPPTATSADREAGDLPECPSHPAVADDAGTTSPRCSSG